MTVAWFDLGQRLRAAAEGTPVVRLRAAPVAAVSCTVAVRLTATRSSVRGTVALDGQATTVEGLGVLDALRDAGVTIAAAEATTLVVDDPAALDALVGVAATTGLTGDRAAVAAHIGWWSDRADYPGGRAVVDVTEACRLRWVLGGDPRAERRAATWARAFGLPPDDTASLLGLAQRVAAGRPLRYLDTLAEDDGYAWGLAQTAYGEGRDWRRPDTVARAALGLRGRCDAADLYAAALLDDPIYRRRAVHTGHVVVGEAERLPGTGRRVRVRSDRLDARLRAGAGVAGFVGTPTATSPSFDGEVMAAAVEAGRLVLTLAGVPMTTGPDTGETVTLYAAPPSLRVQRRGRSLYRGHYATRRSWLTTGRPPTPARRDVPLEVLVAGATDE